MAKARSFTLNEKVSFPINSLPRKSMKVPGVFEWYLLGNLDLVNHFTTRTETFPGTAMIVAMSREVCVDLYNAIVAVKPDWHSADPAKGVIKIVMTGSASDKAKMLPQLHDKKTQKLFEAR
ncbi:type I site-specific restriction-modification system, R (restriction) subunit [Vibrio vulnificus YJ016]|uniref:Type I site-specific restriction-modification system, R (Restriction) subunit n=1 Tax=Vibrio vulnificus (strain YJ016) TaxID=196600 RepID=Q7MBR1_VIBVY|nr:type I site-specific restriction-modification system, R (restriction) subunit [Vibrio vulnificus YJ016]